MVADAAKAFKPKVLYPYHYGDTDVFKLVTLLKDTPEVEVSIRMKLWLSTANPVMPPLV
jgi:hypothetical protein